jgi:hypothetical protein
MKTTKILTILWSQTRWGKKNNSICKRISCAGVTLFELLVAVLLLAMVSGMIYSVLHTSIRFSEKGEKKIQEMTRQHGLLELMHKQIKCAWYDNTQNKIMISADNDILRVVTRHPLLYRSVGLVLAVYRYNGDEQAMYYLEKKDFYNLDYNDQYVPDFDAMELLAPNSVTISMSYDDEAKVVTVEAGETSYEFIPRASDIVHGQGL